MRISFLLVLAGIILYCCTNQGIKYKVTVSEASTWGPTVILMNPTVKNLKTFAYLTENKIFPIEGKYQVLGVYHVKSINNYESSEKYLQSNKMENFRLLEISDSLQPQSLYKSNSCTEKFRSIFRQSRGIIFFGGPDIPPTCYNAETLLLTQVEDPYRHYLELSFLFHLTGGNQDTTFVPFLSEDQRYPILGICLGMQSMNVAAGGTLYQDIPTQIYNLETAEQVLQSIPEIQHRNYHTNFGTDNDLIWNSFHTISYEKKGFFDRLKGGASQLPFVWSSHHQCVRDLGKDYFPIAWSTDGKVVEAIAHRNFPNVLGVQFHPEPQAIYDSSLKLNQVPFEKSPKAYSEMYSGNLGLDFHLQFWKEMGERFSRFN